MWLRVPVGRNRVALTNNEKMKRKKDIYICIYVYMYIYVYIYLYIGNVYSTHRVLNIIHNPNGTSTFVPSR
jgi:hypothetical protein